MSGFSETHYLEAILAEIRHIRAFVRGYDYERYASDLKTQYAVERAILNLSEAVRNFEKHGKRIDPAFNLNSVSSEIEWAKIKGIGNVMRHDYEDVSARQVWGVAADHLDGLEAACVAALEVRSGN